ncbi:MAG: DUF4429 domain-containing protein [Haloglomus sp.]
MVDVPWRRSSDGDADADADEGPTPDPHADAVVVCEFQDGTIAVYDDRVVIERVSRSRFDDRTISLDEVTGVDYSEGITIGHLQLEQTGVDASSGGLLSDPVDENTVHFGRGSRDCAREVRDAVLERASG